eukprot:6818666-Pyramimonas_sp.AAC.1
MIALGRRIRERYDSLEERGNKSWWKRARAFQVQRERHLASNGVPPRTRNKLLNIPRGRASSTRPCKSVIDLELQFAAVEAQRDDIGVIPFERRGAVVGLGRDTDERRPLA